MRSIALAGETDREGWRHAARALVLAGVPPDQVSWHAEGRGDPLPTAEPGARFTLPRAVVALIDTALGSDDPERFGLLYRLVWRVHGGERGLLDAAADPDVRRAQELARNAQRAAIVADPAPLARAREVASGCRACPLWAPATQTVFGEGPANADVMLVGEQPGDQEDVQGRPFVGPAGQVLDRALAEAGIDRREVYVTNAVKHFKYVQRGQRRLHQTPEADEIAICRFWLDLEREQIKPRLTVLLGGSAARGVLGRTVTIGRERGRPLTLPDGSAGFVTVHPSYLLRLPDEAAKDREYAAFVADLRAAGRLVA
jgi:uracil-DNA glycosylase family protein